MMKDEASHESKATPAKKDNKSSNNTNNNNNSKSADSSCLENLPKSASSNDNKSSWKKDKPKDSTKLGKNGRLTTKEQERRIKEGLCLYCGEKGHVAQDCTKSKAAKARAAAFASTDSMLDSADSKRHSQQLVQPMWAEGCVDLDHIANLSSLTQLLFLILTHFTLM